MLLVTLWPSIGDLPTDFGIEGGGGSVSALLGWANCFPGHLGISCWGQFRRKERGCFQCSLGSVLSPTMVRAWGSVCNRVKERTFSYLIPLMALEGILPFAKVRPYRRAGNGVIHKLLVSCLEVARRLFLSSNTRKWPVVYT